jgi:hypothetical protein
MKRACGSADGLAAAIAGGLSGSCPAGISVAAGIGGTPPTAPFSVTKGSGLGMPAAFTLQAMIRDNGSLSPAGYSTSNSVVLRVVP